MKIKELINEMEYEILAGSEETEITTLVYDSRKVEKGSVFVCISGSKGSSGHCRRKGCNADRWNYIYQGRGQPSGTCLHVCGIFWASGKKIKDDRYYRNKRKNNDNLYGSFDSRVCGDQNRTDRHDRIDCWF